MPVLSKLNPPWSFLSMHPISLQLLTRLPPELVYNILAHLSYRQFCTSTSSFPHGKLLENWEYDVSISLELALMKFGEWMGEERYIWGWGIELDVEVFQKGTCDGWRGDCTHPPDPMRFEVTFYTKCHGYPDPIVLEVPTAVGRSKVRSWMVKGGAGWKEWAEMLRKGMRGQNIGAEITRKKDPGGKRYPRVMIYGVNIGVHAC